MKEPFDLVHQNRYRLSCRPDPTPDGTFLARVLISWIGDDREAQSHRLRPDLAAFSSASEAAIAAREAAIAWLDGMAPESMATAAASAERQALPTAPPAA